MRNLTYQAASMACLTLLSLAAGSASGAVIINEVYPGGGSGTAGTAFTRDYVELYNTGTTSVDLTGWRVTYASATGNFGTNNVVAFQAGSFIAPGDFLLLVSGGAGTAGIGVPAANYYNGGALGTTGASLAAAGGSIKLFDAANVSIDTVGYGTSGAVDANGINKVETAAAPAPTGTPTNNAFSISRTAFGDTNNNSVDFTSGAPSPTPGLFSAVVVPEPTSLAVLGGLAAAAFRRRRA